MDEDSVRINVVKVRRVDFFISQGGDLCTAHSHWGQHNSFGDGSLGFKHVCQLKVVTHGNVECKVCLTLPHITSTKKQTPNHRILGPIHYPLHRNLLPNEVCSSLCLLKRQPLASIHTQLHKDISIIYV